MAEAWMASLLAFLAGVIVGIYLGKRRWDKNIQEEDCEEPTEQRGIRTGARLLWRIFQGRNRPSLLNVSKEGG